MLSRDRCAFRCSLYAFRVLCYDVFWCFLIYFHYLLIKRKKKRVTIRLKVRKVANYLLGSTTGSSS